jgi:hypothetical protein
MNRIPRGRERRLTDRFAAFDDYRNSRAWAIGGMMLGPIAIAILLVKYMPLPDITIIPLLAASVVSAFIGGSIYTNITLRAFAENNGLTCSRCNSPLVHTGLMDSHHASNYRQPYTVPKACRRCGLAINDAARPKKDG